MCCHMCCSPRQSIDLRVTPLSLLIPLASSRLHFIAVSDLRLDYHQRNVRRQRQTQTHNLYPNQILDERGSRCPRASATPHPGSVAAVPLLSSQAPVCLQVSVSICRLRLGSARLGLLFAALTEEGKEEEEGGKDCCLATGGRELSDSHKTGC